ncbi:MAG: lamin tail domain-containing protein [bacterium]
MKKIAIVFLFFLSACGGEESTKNSDIVINEIFVKSSDDTKTDWIELYNKGTGTIDLSGWVIMDEKDRTPYTIKDGTKLASKKYLLINQDKTGDKGFAFGLGSGDKVRLYNNNEVRMDKIKWESGDIPEDKSLGRVPDGSETIKITATPTPGASNK